MASSSPVSWLCGICLALLLAACGGGSRQPLDIGSHQGTMAVPAGQRA